eukprot:3676615-Pyramimonas_sp.AAC.2
MPEEWAGACEEALLFSARLVEHRGMAQRVEEATPRRGLAAEPLDLAEHAQERDEVIAEKMPPPMDGDARAQVERNNMETC